MATPRTKRALFVEEPVDEDNEGRRARAPRVSYRLMIEYEVDDYVAFSLNHKSDAEVKAAIVDDGGTELHHAPMANRGTLARIALGL